jgi:hypothetical protein
MTTARAKAATVTLPILPSLVLQDVLHRRIGRPLNLGSVRISTLVTPLPQSVWPVSRSRYSERG